MNVSIESYAPRHNTILVMNILLKHKHILIVIKKFFEMFFPILKNTMIVCHAQFFIAVTIFFFSFSFFEGCKKRQGDNICNS